MTDDPVSDALRLCKAESSFRPINHLRRSGTLTEDDWDRIEDELPINGGRRPGEYTAANEAHRQKFYGEVRARMKADGLRGPIARERIVREIYPRYETLPDGSRFELTRAFHIAEKGLATVRKKRRPTSDS